MHNYKEKLEGEAKFFCNETKCNDFKDSTKTMQIYEAPPILIFAL